MSQPLIGLGKLLNNSWDAILKEWKSTLGWTLGAILVPSLIIIIFTIPQFIQPTSKLNVILSLAAIIFSSLASIYFSAGLMRFFLNEKKETSVSLKDVLSIIWISFLLTILLVPAFIFLIIPGIWLSIALCMSVPIYLKEGMSGWQAIKHSYQLTKGRWWATFLSLFIPGLIYMVGVSIITNIITGLLLGSFTAVNALTSGSAMQFGITAIIAAIIAIIINLFSMIILMIAQISVLTDTYKSLKETYTN